MANDTLHTMSGRKVSDLNLEGVASGELMPDDFRISAESLIRQAETAEQAGYAELGRNFRRAAELTNLGSKEIFDIYETLRPGRTSKARLMELAEHLETRRDAPLTAKLVRDAAEAYFDRGFIKAE